MPVLFLRTRIPVQNDRDGRKAGAFNWDIDQKPLPIRGNGVLRSLLSRISGLLQHAMIERQPTQITVDQAQRFLHKQETQRKKNMNRSCISSAGIVKLRHLLVKKGGLRQHL